MSALASTTQWGSYLDLKETTTWLQFQGIPVGDQQTELQRMIDAACTRMQNMAGRPLGATRFQERHDGWSGEYIQLRYSPFLQLVTCTEWQSSGGPITLTESTPANPTEGLQIDYATSRIMRVFAGYSWPRPFFPGSRNIEVTYYAGFNPVPPDVWQATVDLVAYWWRNTQQSSRSAAGGPRPAGSGGAEMYGGDQQDQGGLYPGIPNRIAEVAQSYWLPSFG